MVVFRLDVGESHEHSHKKQVETIVVDGCAEIVIGDARKSLEKGTAVSVPAEVSHTLVNTGRDRATVECRPQ